MLTREERLITGLKSWLDRLNYPWRERQTSIIDDQTMLTELHDPEQVIDDNKLGPGDLKDTYSLQEIAQQPGLPPYSVVLGICQENLPFVLELSNPAPGSILIVGNAGSGKTRLISSILASASLLNSTEQVIYHLIAQNPQEHDAVTRSIHCREVLSAEDIAAWDLIDKLAFMAEQRRKNNREDPTILLMIDDIDYLVQFMDRDIYLRLYWLIRHGPISRIWTIATLQTNFIDKQDMRFLTAFRTLIAGQTTLRNIKNGLFTERLSNLPDLTAGSEFYLPMEGVGVVFRIGDL